MLLQLALVPGARAASPLETTDLFTGGQDGYQVYRIPGIVVTPRGTVLAYCEARRGGRGDWGAIDILLRRSADGAKTWSAPKKIADVPGPKRKNPVAVAQNLAQPDDVTYNNPLAIVDAKRDVIHFLYCLEYERCFYQRSDDDGQSFSQAVEITSAFDRFRPEYDWKVLATGPGHGVQLKTGRLVVPVWLSLGTGGHAHRPSAVATIYSDDGGGTWQRGAIVVNDGGPLVNPSEAGIAELADGRVMLNIRSESPDHRRAIAISPDGATNWTAATFDQQLVEPICLGSLCTLNDTRSDGKKRLLFVNPANLERVDGKAAPGKSRDRQNLTVRLSYDEGQSWAVSKVLEPGASAYADLAVAADGTIFCLYERGRLDTKNKKSKPPTLTLARFSLGWLSDGRDTFEAAGPPAR